MAAAVAVAPALEAARPTVHVRGLDGGGVVDGAGLAQLSVRARAEGPLPVRLHLRVDGEQVAAGDRDTAVEADLGGLDDGAHTVSVTAESLFGWSETTAGRALLVDATPPRLQVPARQWVASRRAAGLSGRAVGATEVRVGGRPVPVQDDGSFRAQVPSPPGTVEVVALDAVGNATRDAVQVGVRHPGMRAVHVSISAWKDRRLREPILEMIRTGRIDTVELDIKDEAGRIGYDSAVGMADRIGADGDHYDVERVTARLHEMGVRVVGRLVCFKDPVLAEAAWRAGRRRRVIQTPGGGPYSGGYGPFAFTNFADPAVRAYNIDLAVEAVERGFDGILFDYIRRPDGPLAGMVVPGLATSPTASITSFTQQASAAIHRAGGFVGVSVFGIAATRPDAVGQDVARLAAHADYIAPMVYPSHWGPGEYGVAHPDAQPYPIVKRSLRDVLRAVEGSGAQVIPWLQDFSLGVRYGPRQVRAQIDAARDVGIDSFLLWNPRARYTRAALATGR